MPCYIKPEHENLYRNLRNELRKQIVFFFI